MNPVRISREEGTDVPKFIEQHPGDPSFAHPAHPRGYPPRPTTLRTILHALYFAPLAIFTIVVAALHQRQTMPKLDDVKLLHLKKESRDHY